MRREDTIVRAAELISHSGEGIVIQIPLAQETSLKGVVFALSLVFIGY